MHSFRAYREKIGKNRLKNHCRHFPDWVVARLGVMEFLASGLGDTALQNDMTYLRGIQHIDAGPRQVGSFVLCDQLVVG